MPSGIYDHSNRRKPYEVNLGWFKKGKEHPLWVGSKVTYKSLHARMRRYVPKLDFCENCGLRKPFDLANKSGEYRDEILDWKWLCRFCHMKEDGRFFNLKPFQNLYG